MAERDFYEHNVAPESVEPLLQSARNGSAESLGELTERCRRYLLLVAKQELSPELRAKVAPSDLVQQTLIQVQRNIGEFRGETALEFQAWLRHILMNQARDAVRHYRNTAKRDVSREVSLEVADADAGPMALVDDIDTPSKYAVAGEQLQAMESAIGRLPPLYQQVIELRNVQLLSFGEIGQRIGKSPNAARALWIRALERLRAEMRGCDDSR